MIVTPNVCSLRLRTRNMGREGSANLTQVRSKEACHFKDGSNKTRINHFTKCGWPQKTGAQEDWKCRFSCIISETMSKMKQTMVMGQYQQNREGRRWFLHQRKLKLKPQTLARNKNGLMHCPLALLGWPSLLLGGFRSSICQSQDRLTVQHKRPSLP